jgi:hypothetical protein
MDNDVNIRIKQTLEGNSLPEVKAQLKALQQEMNATNRTTAEGSAKYKELSTATGLLVTRVKQLSNEQRGLDSNLKVSSASALNFGKNLSAIGIGLTLAIGLARQFAQEIWKMAKAGAEFQVLRNHFEKVSGSVKQAAEDMSLLKTASSGNLNEKELMEFTNKMREMGRTTQESAQVLDFAERMTDKMGGTIDEATAKVFKFIETGKGRGFEQMGVNIALVNQRVEELAKSQGKTTATMEVEELATLRLTTFMSMYGDTLDNIKQKQPELDDKLIASEKNFDNLKFSVGILLAEGLEPTITALGKLVTIFDGTASSMKPVDDMLKKISSGLIGTKDLMNALTNPFTTLYNMLTVKLPSAINILTRSFADITNSLSIVAPSSFLSSLFEMVSNVINKVREAVGWLNKLPGVNIDNKQEANSGTSTWKEAKGGTLDKGDSRGGTRGSRNKSGNTIVEELAIESKLVKTLADQYSRLNKTVADSVLEPLGLSANSKLRPADKNTRAQNGSLERKASTEEILSGAIESTNRIKDIFTNLASTLNIGADTFIGKLTSGFDTVLGIMNTIMAVMEARQTIKSFLGLIIPGMATGGLLSGPGSGTSDSILARVSNGEYIVNAQATSQYLPFLNAINGDNSSLSNMFQRYANGGMVNNGNSAIRVDMPDVKLSGSDIYLSWRRQGRKETGRTG